MVETKVGIKIEIWSLLAFVAVLMLEVNSFLDKNIVGLVLILALCIIAHALTAWVNE